MMVLVKISGYYPKLSPDKKPDTLNMILMIEL